MREKLIVSISTLLILAAIFVATTSAQTLTVPRRITQAVDEANLTTLKGNTHPLARPEFDQGEASASLPMARMLMVLQHSAEQDAALQILLNGQQTQGSANFHNWLTPQQYGAQFGPSDADIQAVSAWLGSKGFEVTRVSPGKHIIEFSGTAGQVKDAFHTAIHQYNVNGESHFANASDPQIPAALAPVVVGIKSLHNFRAKPTSHFSGMYRRAKDSGLTQKLSGPEFTFTTNNETFFGLGPTDFATIYNVLPLWNKGIDGSGQSIAIVQETDINLQDIRDFRALFGLPANDPEVVLDGPDPGIDPDVEPEAVIDVTWSGAVAKGAKIKLVVSSSTNTTEGIALSALYIADNNVAPISSMSFGQCELHLGTAGNAFWNAVWQQAAAEGISAFVSAGDGGSAGCDNFDTASMARNGLAISGDASTPYDIAVGGTDFGGNFFDPAAFWSATNNPTTQASALGYIPELPWNNSCANFLFAFVGFSTDPIANCNNKTLDDLNIVGGSGGSSSCISSDGTHEATCTGGYAKPAWQTGTGVPNDGVRDIPDVSLFASNGFLGSFYIICEADLNPPGSPGCDLNPPYLDFAGFGGTSVSSPAFAGILALVDQKTQSRQGNANFVLYKLAAGENPANCNVNAGGLWTSLPSPSCIFNDITEDTNAVPCKAGTANCNTESGDAVGVLSGYNAGVGFDLTTGLGSVNATNLVNNWKSVTFTPTFTSLSLWPNFAIHGQPVQVNVSVNAWNGTPFGQVALKTNNIDPAGDLTLGASGTVSTAVRNLPGGASFVTADYFGDGTFARSVSNPVPVFVFPEPSTTTLSPFTLNAAQTGYVPFTGGQYGSIVWLRADVAGKSGFGTATGNLIFTDNGRPIQGNPYKLNSEGNTLTPDAVTTFAVGTHRIGAAYEGDASFLPSNAAPYLFTITKAPTATTVTASAASATAGTSLTFTATVSTAGFGNPPSGHIVFAVNGKAVAHVPLVGGANASTGASLSTATFTATLPTGSDTVGATYQGDENYTGSAGSASVSIAAQ
jgi:subtilase family serine protease